MARNPTNLQRVDLTTTHAGPGTQSDTVLAANPVPTKRYRLWTLQVIRDIAGVGWSDIHGFILINPNVLTQRGPGISLAATQGGDSIQLPGGWAGSVNAPIRFLWSNRAGTAQQIKITVLYTIEDKA